MAANSYVRTFALIAMAALAPLGAEAQAAPASQPAAPVAAQGGQDQPGDVTDPDASLVGGAEQVLTPAQLKEQAWTMLHNAVFVSTVPLTRTQGLGALGQLGSTPRALALIEKAMHDRDPDIRTAAALAAAQTRAPGVTTPLRALLDDKEPQVALAAALALWRLNDHSGEDILMAVVDGQRRSAPGAFEGALHDASRDLHSPATLARMGALQGASMFLGPFGMGLSAYEYLHKNGGDSSRVAAVEDLAQNHTRPIHDELLSALHDKDPGVRAAAAKAVSRDREPATATAIAKLLYDNKPPVRFAAASAYLICTGAAASSPDPSQTTHKR